MNCKIVSRGIVTSLKVDQLPQVVEESINEKY